MRQTAKSMGRKEKQQSQHIQQLHSEQLTMLTLFRVRGGQQGSWWEGGVMSKGWERRRDIKVDVREEG